MRKLRLVGPKISLFMSQCGVDGFINRLVSDEGINASPIGRWEVPRERYKREVRDRSS
jgi:hypothetical protein